MISAATSCPKHPEKAAVLACARCGTFACEACRSTDDARLCAECGVRYAAVHFDVGGILQGGFQLLFRHPGAVAALCGIQVLMGLAILPITMDLRADMLRGDIAASLSRSFPSLGILMAVSLLLSSAIYAVLTQFFGQSLVGGELSLGKVVPAGLRHAPALLGLYLLLTIIVTLGWMMCLVPGVLLGIGLVFSIPAVVLEPTGPIDAMALSWARTRGNRLNVFLLMLAALAIILAVSIAGAVSQAVLGGAGKVGLVISTVFQQGLNGLGAAFFLAVVTLGYLQLSRRWVPGAVR